MPWNVYATFFAISSLVAIGVGALQNSALMPVPRVLLQVVFGALAVFYGLRLGGVI